MNIMNIEDLDPNSKKNKIIKKIIAGALCLIVLTGTFVIGMRCGASGERKIQVANHEILVDNYERKINKIEAELEEEKQIEHVEVEYIPLTGSEIDLGIAIKGYEATMIAQTIYGEANGCSITQKAAVAWTILNRVDAGRYGDSIETVVTTPNQFQGYSPNNPVTAENWMVTVDVMCRWYLEKLDTTIGSVGRVLPSEYCSFRGKGGINHFYANNLRDEWNWSLGNPYGD